MGSRFIATRAEATANLRARISGVYPRDRTRTEKARIKGASRTFLRLVCANIAVEIRKSSRNGLRAARESRTALAAFSIVRRRIKEEKTRI